MPVPDFAFLSLDVLSVEGGGSLSDRKYTVTLRGVVNHPGWVSSTINNREELPPYGSIFLHTPPGEGAPTSFDTRSILISKKSKLEDPSNSKQRWIITLEYGPEQEGPASSEGSMASNPLEERPEVTGTFIDFMRAIDKDVNGKAIESSSKETFDPPVEVEDSILEIVCAKNYATVDWTALEAIKGKLNSDAIFGGAIAAGKGRAKAFQIVQKWHANSPYYRITSTIQIKDSWQVKKLDQGFSELLDLFENGPQLYRILDKDGNPIQTPALLDGTGKRLPRTGTSPPDPVFRTFDVIPSTSYAILDLPPLPSYTPPTPPGP